MKRILALALAMLTVLAALPALSLSSLAEGDYTYAATTFYGEDLTDRLSNGDPEDDYGGLHWYERYTGYQWTIENGRLVLGGFPGCTVSGETAEDFPWSKYADEITEIVILPDSVSSIEGPAFAALTKVKTVYAGAGLSSISGTGTLDNGADGITVHLPSTLTAIGNGVMASCTNVTLVLDGMTKSDFLSGSIGEGNEGLLSATFVENEVQTVEITPTENGIVNRDGKTWLDLNLSLDGAVVSVPESYTWKISFADGLLYTDSDVGYFSSAMKLVAAKPTVYDTENGAYSYALCELEGDDQFVPQFGSTYKIAVQIFDEEGNLVYNGLSGRHEFYVTETAIYEKRTSAPALASLNNYVLLDFYEAVKLGSIAVTCGQYSGRFYQWVAYGSNDPDAPLSKWTYLCEQKSERESTAGAYTLSVDPVAQQQTFRYVKVLGIRNSSNWGFHIAEIAAYERATFSLTGLKVTTASGDDESEFLTDGSCSDYLDSLHWYEEYKDYQWIVEGGRLVLGGYPGSTVSGETAEDFPWSKYADKITEIVILPGSVSSIEGPAFATLTKVKTVYVGEGLTSIWGTGTLDNGADGITVHLPSTLTTIGNSVMASCTNVTLVLGGMTKNDFLSGAIGAGNEGLLSATYIENEVQSMAVTPAESGFANRDGKTWLDITLKDDSGAPIAVDENVEWKITLTDGERRLEGGTYLSSAMKLITAKPTAYDAANGVYSFAICELEGADQFIPQYDVSYVVNVQLFDEQGLFANGTSSRNVFRVGEQPIFGERTSTPALASQNNYLQIDLGQAQPVYKVGVSFLSTSGYSQWIAYGSNDPNAPLSEWTYVCEKKDTTSSNGLYYAEAKEGEDGFASYRYLRIVGVYNTDRWTLFFNEVDVQTDATVPTYGIGNLNGDERVSISDVTALLNYLAASENDQQMMMEEDLVSFLVDVNGSGTVDIKDVTALLDILAGN